MQRLDLNFKPIQSKQFPTAGQACSLCLAENTRVAHTIKHIAAY